MFHRRLVSYEKYGKNHGKNCGPLQKQRLYFFWQ
jgi:hypothetical protein